MKIKVTLGIHLNLSRTLDQLLFFAMHHTTKLFVG